MNLIRDAWLPVIRASGKKDKIAPWQIAERVDPVIEVNAPRPDFQGALYQFLIGLLQTCYAPADHDEWLDLWENPPAEDMLQAKFTNVASAFELDDPTGPAFMQDFNLPKGEMRNIATLLMDFPGDKTIVDNLDHFVKRGSVAKMCPACAAMALFTLQINAPAGGNGHRVGLRGGGPLTTLVKPTEDLDLWSKLWLNVLNAEDIADSIEKPTADVFPWMGPTRVSTQKVVNKIKHYIGEGVPTTPADAHPLQHYWGMPRRIRILSRADAIGKCNLCGDDSANVVSDCRTGTWGVDYVGAWVHPLTPYRFDANKEKPPLSFKGQEGGVGYRDWIALVLAHSDKGECAAKCARVYMDQRARDIGDQRFARLWCFGYDMNKMQARCWYDHTLPLFGLDETQRENVLSWAGELIDAAGDIAKTLQTQVKSAWFSRPGDVKTDDVRGVLRGVVKEFWQQSEPVFYNLLERLIGLPGNQRLAPPDIYDTWVRMIQALAYSLFDIWTLEAPAEDLDMKRIIAARLSLTKKMNHSGQMKTLFAKANSGKGVENAASTTLPLP